MKKRLLSGILGIALCCSPLYSKEETLPNKDKYIPTIQKQELAELEVTDVIDETFDDVEEKGVTTRGSISAITRILYEMPEKTKDRRAIEKMGIVEGFSYSLREKYEKDPLFYDWRMHDIIDSKTGEMNSFVWKGKFTKAIGDVVVANSNFLKYMEKVGNKIKEETTWNPTIKKTEISVSPDINLEGKAGVNIKFDSPNKYLDNGKVRVNNEGVKVGTEFDFLAKKLGPRSRLIIDLDYNTKEKDELIFKITWKVPEIGYTCRRKGKTLDDIDWNQKF